MPLNRDKVQTTRWYQLCFVPTSPDDSDDSDIESVVLTPSTTWQELSLPLSPPPPPPNPEPQIDWRFFPPPPPPPPDFVPPPDFLPHSPPLRPITRFSRQQPPSSSHVIEGDQSEWTVDVMNGISRVRISEIDEHTHCPICMEEFKVDDQACQLPCNHIYCSECILRWLEYNKTCPVCRLWLNDHGSDTTNGNNSLESQLEILPPPPPAADNDWELQYFLPPFEGMLVVENSAGGDEDEADYYSAYDSQEEGASQSAPAPLT